MERNNSAVSAPMQGISMPPLTRGQVRRFEQGASGIGWDDFLRKLGFEVQAIAGRPGQSRVIDPNGKLVHRSVSKVGLIDILDRERVRLGLEPVRRCNRAVR